VEWKIAVQCDIVEHCAREIATRIYLKVMALAVPVRGCWPRRKLGMPDYIQLLESKLSPTQKQALNAMTDVARARGITVFLTGGAVRDLVSGASVRDLDITVQANPLKFKKDLEKAGFAITGLHEPSQTIYLRFGKQARVEISAARTENFPKPARPEYHPAGILDDLRRRDFTANAMALSLNEGSWGLLLDPLNGMADISARNLRLAGNYGFLEDPIRMVRAIRLISRTGWDMEERTKTRYDNAKAEEVISAIAAVQRGYELEEIAYEEEPLQVLKALEAEGWMEHLSPVWSSRSADVAGLDRLHERLVQLLMAGLHPDPSAAQFRLLTAKLSPSHMSSLKRLFVRTDLIEEAESLDSAAKKVLQQMTAKDAARPSQLWKLLHSVKPEAVLWLFFTGKGAAIQNRFESFFTKWPEARQKIPNAILQDMRILPDVKGYDELLDKLTFAFMDEELPNEEAIRKFAEPYSPPAPPPPVIVRRSRAVKRVVEPKGSKKAKKAAKQAAEAAAAASASAAIGEPGASIAAAAIPAAATAKVPVGKSSAAKSAAAKAAPAGIAALPKPATKVAKTAKVAIAAKSAPSKSEPKEKAVAKKAQPQMAHKGTSKPRAKAGSKSTQSAHASSAKKPSRAHVKLAHKSKPAIKKARTVHKPTAKKAIARPAKKSAKTAAKSASKPLPKVKGKSATKRVSKPKSQAARPKPKAKKKSGR
jgi:tRNA nucleotidyltransferase (CCA-adding enzyme)